MTLLDLEVWGAPISRTKHDPSNDDFIYQRFRRGIMHYRRQTGLTEAVLVGDYLKQLLLNSPELPADLGEQAAGSRMFAQYCPGAERWVCRPDELPCSDLTFAFEQSLFFRLTHQVRFVTQVRMTRRGSVADRPNTPSRPLRLIFLSLLIR